MHDRGGVGVAGSTLVSMVRSNAVCARKGSPGAVRIAVSGGVPSSRSGCGRTGAEGSSGAGMVGATEDTDGGASDWRSAPGPAAAVSGSAKAVGVSAAGLSKPAAAARASCSAMMRAASSRSVSTAADCGGGSGGGSGGRSPVSRCRGGMETPPVRRLARSGSAAAAAAALPRAGVGAGFGAVVIHTVPGRHRIGG